MCSKWMLTASEAKRVNMNEDDEQAWRQWLPRGPACFGPVRDRYTMGRCFIWGPQTPACSIAHVDSSRDLQLDCFGCFEGVWDPTSSPHHALTTERADENRRWEKTFSSENKTSPHYPSASQSKGEWAHLKVMTNRVEAPLNFIITVITHGCNSKLTDLR